MDPNHQRKGIGRLLLDWGVEQARREGRDVYLVSMPAGRALYLGAGFQEIGEVEILGFPSYHMFMPTSGKTDVERALDQKGISVKYDFP